VLTLGERIAEGIRHSGPKSQEWRWGNTFLVILLLIYVVSAIAVVLTSPAMLTGFVPVIIVTIAIFALFFPSRRAVRSLPTASS
jgi:hypothetical protein